MSTWIYREVNWKDMLPEFRGRGKDVMFRRARKFFKENFRDADAVRKELWKRHDRAENKFFDRGADEVGQMFPAQLDDFADSCFYEKEGT